MTGTVSAEGEGIGRASDARSVGDKSKSSITRCANPSSSSTSLAIHTRLTGSIPSQRISIGRTGRTSSVTVEFRSRRTGQTQPIDGVASGATGAGLACGIAIGRESVGGAGVAVLARGLEASVAGGTISVGGVAVEAVGAVVAGGGAIGGGKSIGGAGFAGAVEDVLSRRALG